MTACQYDKPIWTTRAFSPVSSCVSLTTEKEHRFELYHSAKCHFAELERREREREREREQTSEQYLAASLAATTSHTTTQPMAHYDDEDLEAPLTAAMSNPAWPIFEDATRAVIGCWTVIRLALEHGFGGKNTATKVFDMSETVLDLFAAGIHLSSPWRGSATATTAGARSLMDTEARRARTHAHTHARTLMNDRHATIEKKPGLDDVIGLLEDALSDDLNVTVEDGSIQQVRYQSITNQELANLPRA